MYVIYFILIQRKTLAHHWKFESFCLLEDVTDGTPNSNGPAESGNLFYIIIDLRYILMSA